MAGEPDDDEWTVETLRAHLTSLIDANDRRYEQRFLDSKEAVQSALIAADRATAKAEQSQEKRNEIMNEFRGQLKDQAGTFVTRGDLDLLKEIVTGMIPRSEAYVLVGFIGSLASAVAVISALIGHFTSAPVLTK